MANQLAVDKSLAIHNLRAAGYSQRRIATTLGISRGAVRRHLAAQISNGTEAQTAPDAEAQSPIGDPNSTNTQTGQPGQHDADLPESHVQPTLVVASLDESRHRRNSNGLVASSTTSLARSPTACVPFCTFGLPRIFRWPFRKAHPRSGDASNGELRVLRESLRSCLAAIDQILDGERSCLCAERDDPRWRRTRPLRLRHPHRQAERTSKPFGFHAENHRSATSATRAIASMVVVAQRATSNADTHRHWGLVPKPSADRSVRASSFHVWNSHRRTTHVHRRRRH